MGLASSKAANTIAASSNGVGSKYDSMIVETHHNHPDIQQPCSLLPSPSSGLSLRNNGGGIDTWKSSSISSSCHVRQASIRSRNLQPMPDIGELDRRFAKVLVSDCLDFYCIFFMFLWLKCPSIIDQTCWKWKNGSYISYDNVFLMRYC
ncbi:uncharacterized protein LOC129759252 isoform X1 [Uranotaenia lowii]|uniref:uncharacterized protein LOC129759252 isoform X1 n=1 Tax=Uranotaenia lowii TaxID=190385 RepID=UPI0024784BF5|nr:uncharacterized protein LOC129759252 isoform X1 [Uranotaenia lowii]XP_055612635.1 uncharacterized protein LOC129759252 isoform X1 [Uranotaenia lowii]XP_055612636.1 uncharacterized protein LOC129759252 isoform X1 [Uranotaenia lowii]XP_055612637.1 uncharacterized protein LOC129759252 isoform X1 [Uranotaenia lowii]XP_055612638.1 uncharacterized protein LOC129759252 isoform X1 [Uranotaenia lowii]XP_055612639.1 uncharacterized protein LOC129759252 isoform X1 [Uranotaenia lowii]XP_055612640.1 un